MADFPERSGRTLILGIGNDILSDDGIGIRLIDDLRGKSYPGQLVFEKGTVGGLEILELIQGYQAVLFFDAIKTVNGKPGEIYYMNISDFIDTLHLSNLHDVSFIQAIQLGKALGLQLPETMFIFAVEIIEDRIFSRNFTSEIQHQYHHILTEAEHFIRKMLSANLSSVSPV